MRTKDDLSYEYVSHRLRYESASGTLYWKHLSTEGVSCKKNLKYIRHFNKNHAGNEAGYVSTNGKTSYKRIRLKGKLYLAHRLVWLLHFGDWPKQLIDHVDGDGLNNSINNLRDVAASDNHKNKRMGPRNKSGVVGVHFDKGRKKWRAQIRSCGKLIDLGLAENIFEAACMRKSAEVKHSFHKNHGTTRG